VTGFAEHPRFVGPRILDTCNRRQRTLGIYYYLKLRILTTNRATTLTGCRPIECSTTVFAVLSDRSASDKLAITTCGLMSPIIPDPPPGLGFFETVDLQSILNIHVCRYIISLPTVGASIGNTLTPKEIQIGILVRRCLRNRDIAETLGISEQAMKNRLKIFDKVGVWSRL